MRWKLNSFKEVYRNKWIWVTEDRVTTPRDNQLTFGVVHKDSFPLVIPFDGRYFTLVKQYRYMVNRVSWEFPQGHTDGKTLIEAAKAELLEEAGLKAIRIKYLKSFWIDPGLTDQICYIYIATDLVKAKSKPDPGEDIRATKRVSLSQFNKMIADGLIKDGVTISDYNLFKICTEVLTGA